MDSSGNRAFLLVIGAQALHSIEEYLRSLWQVLAPARFVSALVSSNLPLGFAVVNIGIVAFGAWCYAVPVRRERSYSVPVIWFWIVLEALNGTGHLLLAAASRSWFPGVFTAPLLLASSVYLAMQIAGRNGSR